MSRKSFLLILIIFSILFIGINLSPLLRKDLKDISYSDFRLVIAPFLTTVGILITYTELKRRKN